MTKSIDRELDCAVAAVRNSCKGPLAPLGFVLAYIFWAYITISMAIVSAVFYVYLPPPGKTLISFVAGVFALVAVLLLGLVVNAGVFLFR